MYAVEFETDIDNGIERVPEKYNNLKKVHAKVLLMVDDSVYEADNKGNKINFYDYDIDCFHGLDSVEVQKEMRDEW